MPRTLTLSKPMRLENPFNDTRHIEWYLLDENNNGYFVSWLEEDDDTGLPECAAFKAVLEKGSDARVIVWPEKAVSHNPDAARALEEVVKQLEEQFDVLVSVGDPAAALRPGEVVADVQ